MAEVIPFKKRTLKEKHQGNTLCRSGHHKWKIETRNRFDVKQGKLVTSYRCSRCGKVKNKAQ